ncbi:MAG: hypothetical protein DPW09_24710 [Anaerolineae bacterium]|nr:hypothetical protein [Anaerolineae bacterium]
MTNKSGVSNQVISLPQGGGAQKGIGEKFSPDLHTGTGNFTVPIALPAGRNGFQPELNLVYSTGNGNGPFGLGWNLSIPGVSRKTDKGVPQYEDTDTFILSGAEDLVPVEENAEFTRYRPRTDGLFTRIEHHHKSPNNYWLVHSKDGLKSYYGTPGSIPNDPATIAAPNDRTNATSDDRTKIFAWKLTRTEDPFGNRIEYNYERDTGQQLYLSAIRYSDTDTGQFLVSIEFSYEDLNPKLKWYDDNNVPDEKRIYPFSDYRAGFEIRTTRRCKKIEIKTHAAEVCDNVEAGCVIRTYEFCYLDERSDTKLDVEHLPRPRNGVSLLSQIKVIGHNDSAAQELPPLEFSYTAFDPDEYHPDGRNFFPITGTDLPPASLANPDYELADIFGNGLPDIIQLNGVARYWQNLGNGRFAPPRLMKNAPAGLTLADPGVQLIDANGDGRIDLMVSDGKQGGYYSLGFNGLWDRRSFQRYDVAPSFNLADPEVKLVDLDGDGITDAIRSGTRLEYYFNHPQKGWHKSSRDERKALDDFPNVNFSDPRVKWGDMNGDGLQDILLISDGNVDYWPSLGHGDWGQRIPMGNAPRFPYSYNPQRILVGDVDGDGCADIVYVDNTKVTLWINQCGYRWSDPIEIRGTPPVSDADAVRLADMLGNGISGVLWSSDAGGVLRDTLLFLDFTRGVKPYVLDAMNNNMGSITRVTYASSTQFYQEDTQHHRDRWLTPLPFPVQVVARVEVIDEISGGKLTTEYKYHHGYWDGLEREFRGFGMVEQFDTETFEQYHQPGKHGDKGNFKPVESRQFSPPTLTRTWFHQGPIEAESGLWAESDYGPQFWAGDPQVLTRPDSMQTLLKKLSRSQKRDALRTLRGSILRTELYALDGSSFRERPYTVTETLMGVAIVVEDGQSKAQLFFDEIPPAWPPTDATKPIFFPHMLAQRTTQWERGDEPMTSFTFTGVYDNFGQPRSQINVAVLRGRDFRQQVSPTEPYLVTHTVTAYAQPQGGIPYIFDRVAHTTTYEITNGGSDALFDLVSQIRQGKVTPNIIGQILNYYDGPAFEGQTLGQIGAYGALVRTENLVLTDAILEAAYLDDHASPVVPPYFVPYQTPPWTDEYPAQFRAQLGPLAGYRYYATGGPIAAGYFTSTERRRYDFHTDAQGQGYGITIATRDPLGNETTIRYDGYALLPIEVTDPAGLTTHADYDYRTFQPHTITDPNGNQTQYTFTPLGLLDGIFVRGKAGEPNGDQVRPGTRFEYDFLAYLERRQPISVRTIQRTYHDSQTGISLPERDEIIEKIEYSDGFGRLLQTRTQAEDLIFGDSLLGGSLLPLDQAEIPGPAVGRRRTVTDPPNVVVSGWQVYNNKGQVVEKYEPCFATGWDCQPEDAVKCGQKVSMYYDPRGQVIRTVNPDGSEQRVIFGTPTDLTRPEQFQPTPWEAYTYDVNDNAGRTHVGAASGYQSHWNTPLSVEVDALGRTVKTVERNGPNPMTDWYVTRSTYDIRGNLLTVTDPLGRIAFRHVYDLANNPLRIENIDAGVRRVVLDAAGNEIERRDSKGALILQAYDVLLRPTRLWARNMAAEPMTLRERLIYGDAEADREAARRQNRLGQLYQHYDEAGRLTFNAYDFKGNLLDKSRQVIHDGRLGLDFRLDWQQQTSAELLDPTLYQIEMQYDALNRLMLLRYPQDVEGQRRELHPRYNRAGALEQVALNTDPYVVHIAYNAKGQRTLIAYGNGVMTRYAYDPQTFRLARLRSERYITDVPFTYRPTASNQPLQELAYQYDLAGNITRISDSAPGSGLPARPDELDRAFSYDPLYRLLSATGRECDRPPETPWDSGPRCADLTRTRPYTESYRYDPAGNMLELRHQANGVSFTRRFELAPGGNRLATVTVGSMAYPYTYDANGNVTGETSSRHFKWDHSDRLCRFRVQPEGTTPSVDAYYLYDSAGQRVKKLVRSQGGQTESTVYIDDLFEHHRQNGQQNNSLHVMDNQKRIALVRVGVPFPGDRSPAEQYRLGDHLGSRNLVVDRTSSWINREEFTPYGETSLGGYARKRYRFTGNEKDGESGLYYHRARYFVPWSCRWVSPDPAGIVDGINIYAYVRGNPLRLVDNYGTESVAPTALEEQARMSHPDLHTQDQSDVQSVVNMARVASGATALGGPTEVTRKNLETFSESTSKEAQKTQKASDKAARGAERGERKLTNRLQRSKTTPPRDLEKKLRKIDKLKISSGKLAEEAKSLSKVANRTARISHSLTKFGNGLNVVAAGATAIDQYSKSTTITPFFRGLDTAITARLSFVAGKSHPIAAGVDAAVGLVGDVFDIDIAKHNIADHLQTSIRGTLTLTEAGITGDTRGIEIFHQRSIRGDYGAIFQTASEAGEFWAKEGFIGGLKTFGQAVNLFFE